jgi:hypothetical protein
MLNQTAVEDALGAILALAGVPSEVAGILEAEIISLVDWVGAELAGGRDPVAQLSALMSTAETAAKATEDALFPPKP